MLEAIGPVEGERDDERLLKYLAAAEDDFGDSLLLVDY